MSIQLYSRFNISRLFRTLDIARKGVSRRGPSKRSITQSWPFTVPHSSRSSREFHSVPLSHTIYGQSLTVSDQPTPLIILHGLFGSKQNWNSVAKGLNKRLNRTVITLDSRNHGDSPHSNEMSYQDMAEDVVAFMEDVGLESGIFLGHSMGGKTVMCLSLSRPELVESLIVEDISPRISSSIGLIPNFIEAMKRAELSRADLSLSQARKEIDSQLEWTAKEPGVRAFLLTNLSTRTEAAHSGWEIPTTSGAPTPFCWRVNLPAISSHFMDVMLFPESLPQPYYSGKTLFLGGSKSAYISSDDLPAIQRFFPNAAVKHIEGAGHWVHAEKPKEFMDEVVMFLA